jgi:ABC-type Zn uptake system ZnuABC Zn-binding protein ZnuA
MTFNSWNGVTSSRGTGMPTWRRATRNATLAIVAALASSALTACSSIESDDELLVVTTTTQVSDFSRNVLGDAGQVYPLLQANQTAHSFDPSARDLLELNKADALVINGHDLEPWVDDAVIASGFDGLIIVASDGIEPLTRDGVIDPHVWTSPLNAITMTQNIASGLATLSPADSEVFSANADEYELKLGALDAWIRETVDEVPEEARLLVTNHDAFTYFVDEFGITLVGSIIPEFDDNAEPSAADIDALIEKIRATGATAIFAESSIPSKLAETVATETGIAIYAGEDSLYSDTLGAPGSGAETYISSTVHNVTRLADSWGVTPPPIPELIADA